MFKLVKCLENLYIMYICCVVYKMVFFLVCRYNYIYEDRYYIIMNILLINDIK